MDEGKIVDAWEIQSGFRFMCYIKGYGMKLTALKKL